MVGMRKLKLVVLLALVGTVAYAASDRPKVGMTRLHHQANGAAEWLDRGVEKSQFSTGADLFNREWAYGTAQMAALGFGQMAAQDEANRALHLARMETAIEAMLSPEGRAFHAGLWDGDPLEGTRGHAAWLGYTNLALSLHRSLVPDSKYAALNDRISDTIAERVLAEPSAVFETYPDQRFPVDTAAGIASVMLHDRVTGRDHAAAIAHWRKAFDGHQRAADNRLLYQMTRADGRPRVAERGSGTFLAAWFLSFGDREVGCELYTTGRDTLADSLGPVAGMREYAPGVEGRPDIDSGPIVLGLGLSSTGFALGAAHACGDEDTVASLARTVEWFGAASDDGEVLHWQAGEVFGGAPIADAIMFAMMSTPER